MTILEKVDGVDWLMGLDDGSTMYAFTGVGHSDADLIETVRALEDDDDLHGMFLDVTEGTWGWSPRFKHCSNHDDGWGCDNEGEWHRHYSVNYGHDPVTGVTVRNFEPMRAGERPGERVIPIPAPPTHTTAATVANEGSGNG
ncbi:hypothetical protein D6T64_11925 [Cryobacterium melibiosiphilum]|uniref:Uncharacterized protein n=1 Tax=Cryobacterium melibiosiphilum TaxID=995039 RepID=A0A3A5MGW0_9MICO|nr:hypothetical protein [Cryobacterium melibiosiphilum]RJT88091.1 hypothetical protein D6T64_11925 [Cryobacterium melibiosiphilum]